MVAETFLERGVRPGARESEGKVRSFLPTSSSRECQRHDELTHMQRSTEQRLSARRGDGGAILAHRAVVLGTGQQCEVENMDVAGAACATSIGGWRSRFRERACLRGRRKRLDSGLVNGYWCCVLDQKKRERGVSLQVP
jgi:hypothetical protein